MLRTIDPKGQQLGTRACGFTIIELLIVASVIAIFAATLVHAFGDSSAASREAALKSELANLRKTIDRYHADHGYYPGVRAAKVGATCPRQAGSTLGSANSADALRATLAAYSNKRGEICLQKSADFPFGPYAESDAFYNPVTESTDVEIALSGDLVLIPTRVGGGFIYAPDAGRLIANDSSMDTTGIMYARY